MDKSRNSFLDEVAEFLGENGSDELLLTSHALLVESAELLASNEPPPENRDALIPAKSPEEDSQQDVPRGKVSAEKRREIRNAQAAKRRLRYRQQLKEERETLKLQANELSRKLLEFQTAQEERKAGKERGLMFAAWKALAVRQLERRVQAEKLQKRLRAEVVGNARVIHEMNVQMYAMSQSRCIMSSRLIEGADDVVGVGLLGAMLAELDEHYAQTDRVFQGLEFKPSIPASYNYKLTRKYQEGVLYLDSADRMEFPYDVEHTVNAMSKVIMSDPGTDLESGQMQDVKDTLTAKYRAKYQLKPGICADVDIHGATKKFREKDRIVFVSRWFSEGRGEIEGFNSSETLWMVIRPGESELGGTSLVESYVRLVPIRFGGCDEDMDKFVKFIVQVGQEESKQFVDRMEKLLICEP